MLTPVTLPQVLHDAHGGALAEEQNLLVIPLLLVARTRPPPLLQMPPQQRAPLRMQRHALLSQHPQEEVDVAIRIRRPHPAQPRRRAAAEAQHPHIQRAQTVVHIAQDVLRVVGVQFHVRIRVAPDEVALKPLGRLALLLPGANLVQILVELALPVRLALLAVDAAQERVAVPIERRSARRVELAAILVLLVLVFLLAAGASAAARRAAVVLGVHDTVEDDVRVAYSRPPAGGFRWRDAARRVVGLPDVGFAGVVLVQHADRAVAALGALGGGRSLGAGT